MLHAMQRRADRVGRPMPDVFLRYARGCTGGAARVAAERARWPERWERVLATVRAFEAGELRNPCPGADGWGGTAPGTERDRERMDAAIASGKWAVVECSERTANVFLRRVGR